MFGQPLAVETLAKMIEHLDRAHFLEGPTFETHYGALLAEFRTKGIREVRSAEALGLTGGDGLVFRGILEGAESPQRTGPVAGLIVPHLDYPRGGPCYGAGYACVAARKCPERIVVLGTNHFGRSTSVVGTANDFVTPLGRTPTDREFISQLEARCGDLRQYELDHAREHSAELQVAWLQHVYGPERFKLAAFLCPDICGPTGTKPHDGAGCDLREFALALAETINEDGVDTLLVAGADLSHVGAAFGDERQLDSAFLGEVEAADRAAIAELERGKPEEFAAVVARRDNDTRICSMGCMYALATALANRTPTLLRYHQAVDEPTQTCVTCCAMVYAS
jgi:AmmeMemoRadiSam system protein B